jgi:hypothetical protein
MGSLSTRTTIFNHFLIFLLSISKKDVEKYIQELRVKLRRLSLPPGEFVLPLVLPSS